MLGLVLQQVKRECQWSCHVHKAAVNAPQSKRSARFADARQSRSVWTARVFSTAFTSWRKPAIKVLNSRPVKRNILTP